MALHTAEAKLHVPEIPPLRASPPAEDHQKSKCSAREPVDLWGIAHATWGIAHVTWGSTHTTWGIIHAMWGIAHVTWGSTHATWGIIHAMWGIVHAKHKTLEFNAHCLH